jgi:hypothetical protein
MPLLTPSQQINAALADHAKSCALHIASASVIANRMVESILALSDEALTEWLNAQSPQEIQSLLGAHGNLGAALNTAGNLAWSVLLESGIAVEIPDVDIRDFAEKLDQRGRDLAFEGGQFSVTTRPPEPEPAEAIEE